MANKELSVVLPCYQEEENLRILLPRIIKVLKNLQLDYEILIIDTNTPMDESKSVCLEFEEDCVRYHHRKPGNFYADAVRSGIEFADGAHIVFMDADGSHSPEFIPHLLEYKNDHDLVVASRYIDGGYTENSKSLVYMSKIVNLAYSFVLGVECKDVSGSFKLYKAQHLKSVDLHCKNFDVIEELLFKIAKNNPGLKIKEIPYTFKQRLFGDSKRSLLVFIWTYFMTLMKLWLSSKKSSK